MLEINNLDLNNLISSSNISATITTKAPPTKRFKSTIAIKAPSIKGSKSKVIRRPLVERVVAIRVSKPSIIVALITIIRYAFPAESYRS